MDYELVALVPMKGHSERVKNKNLKEFHGKPLLFYILDTLKHARVVSHICVDTDSQEIKETVEALFGNVEVLMRPEELRGDFVSMNDIIRYDMSMIKAEHYLQTHATNPLLEVATIEDAYAKYKKELPQYDSLFSVNRWQTRLYDADAKPINHDPKKLIRTQDLQPLFEENSNMYFFSELSFQRANARIGLHPQIYEMDKLESIDIDEPSDFMLAEQLYKLRKEDN